MHTAEQELARETWRRANGRHLLLLLDFDGTLSEFQADPDAVYLLPARREILARLQERATIGIVSGRRLEDVRRRVSLDGIIVAGLHGLEISTGHSGNTEETRHRGNTEETQNERFVHPDLASAMDVITEVGDRLRASIDGLPGVFVEDKGASVALHFREANAVDQARAVDAFADATKSAVERGAVRVMRGSKVLELLPNIDWNKGSAVRWIAERVEQQAGPSFIIYIGDDVTDQDALDMIERGGGLAIAASDRVTASIHVDGPAAVERFLAAL